MVEALHGVRMIHGVAKPPARMTSSVMPSTFRANLVTCQAFLVILSPAA